MRNLWSLRLQDSNFICARESYPPEIEYASLDVLVGGVFVYGRFWSSFPGLSGAEEGIVARAREDLRRSLRERTTQMGVGLGVAAVAVVAVFVVLARNRSG